MVDAKNLTIGTFVALSVILSGVIVTDTDNSYYCESKDLVGICDKLSSGIGTRCYFEDTYKYCPDGWKPLEGFVDNPVLNETIQKINIFGNTEVYICDVIDGEIESYSICVAPSGKEAYAGELI